MIGLKKLINYFSIIFFNTGIFNCESVSCLVLRRYLHSVHFFNGGIF